MKAIDCPTLCDELDPLILAELDAGNGVDYVERATTRGDATLVMLAAPFHAPRHVPPSVERIDVHDPHWWSVEYRCTIHGHQVVCPSAVA